MTRQKGFSLIEVMIALALIAIALTAVIRTQGQSLRLSSEARFISSSVFLAQGILSEACMSAGLVPGVEEGTFENHPYLIWRREIDSAGEIPGLMVVNVTVHREGEPPDSGITLRGLVYGKGT